MTAGAWGQVATIAACCIVIAAVLFVAGLAEIHHAIECERLRRGRDDHEEAARADMASMPDRMNDIGEWFGEEWI